MLPEPRRFVGVGEVAALLAVPPSAVVALLESGELRGIRVAGAWRIDAVEVESWIAAKLEHERRSALWRQSQAASVVDLFALRPQMRRTS